MTPTRIVALLVAGLAALPSNGAEPAPWTARVPALPTGSYRSDGYAAKLATAQKAVTQDIERQKAINEQLTKQVKSIDPMELASRQQQYMMDHPQEAMQLMQRNQAIGSQQANDARLAAFSEEQALQKDLDAVDARYKAALAAEFAPVDAKFKELDARASKDLELTEAGAFYKPWAIKEWNVLNQQRNAAYERVGATWWGASGPFHAWLKRYRDYLERQIPVQEEADSLGAGFMVILVGTPTASFQSTAKLDAADKYMVQVAKVFERRWEDPVPAAEGIESGKPARK